MTYTGTRYRLAIESDSDVEHPFDDMDMLGTIVHWHSRYTLGGEGEERLPRDSEAIHRWVRHREARGDVVLPLYLYDHSGLRASVYPFSCPWDSGQVGFIYATREAVLKEYGGARLTHEKRMKAVTLLRAEVRTLDTYLSGDIVGFVLYERSTCGRCHGTTQVELADGNIELCPWRIDGISEEETDSCWGFYGSEVRFNGILDHLTDGVLADLGLTRPTEEEWATWRTREALG